ncbi:ribonuclease H-like domain-containing protein [Lyophyllum atratum]|nr:ribonuclease H-like domain-containing protein [Lyophyllum atratum]
MIDKFLIKCYRTSEPSTHIYRCIAKDCGATYASRASQRALRHARGCNYIPRELQQEARNFLVTRSLGQRVANRKTEPDGAVDVAGASDDVSATKKGKVGSLVTFKDIHVANTKKRQEKNEDIDLAIIQLVCAAGLPCFIVSRPQWINLLHKMDPKYIPASRSKLEEDQIPAEAANVQHLMYEELRKEEDLTISDDGGTSKGRDAFWTVHISTKSRKVYFVEGREATRDSHTAQWLKTWLLEIMDKIGRPRFCSVVSDSTGNTRLYRTLLVDLIPTLFNLADICHHFSNTIKDIVRIDYFKHIILVVRGVIAKIHISHCGTAELDDARARLGIGRGLEAIGKTRFGSIILSARSVQRNIPALKKVVTKGKFDLAEISDSFTEFNGRLSPAAFKFETGLGQLVDIGQPAIKALTYLEANEAAPGDVFVYWHAMLQATLRVLRDPAQAIPRNVQNEIIGILNHRHNQILGDGNLSDSADVYLSGTYLHPLYLDSDVFKRELTVPASTYNVDYTGILYPTIFKRVVNFLSSAAADEIQHGSKPSLTKWKGLGTGFRKQLLQEVQRYARRQYPYNQPYNIASGVMGWWRSIEGQEFADVLPVLAIKIHAVRVNSMAEERTVSTFTWMTPAYRSQLSVGSMVAMTQIRQYYATEKKVITRAVSVPLSLPSH